MLRTIEIAALCLKPENSLKEAMQTLDRTSQGVVLVTGDDLKLLNTVTDGDIRRAILGGRKLDDKLSCILEVKKQAHKHAITAPKELPVELLRDLMIKNVVRQIPLLQPDGTLCGLATFDEVFSGGKAPVEAVIMAGGYGKRLLPLTTHTPKPMLKVGDRPLLQRTIESLRTAGIENVHITTHFAGDKIQEHFGDGADFGVNVRYVEEEKPLGTAGSLANLQHHTSPFLVINGDVLTGVDFRVVCQFHEEHEAELTVCVRQYDFNIPYGVVECDSGYVTAVKEKPTYSFFVNAGIYLVDPSALDLIPPDETFHMTDLIAALIAKNRKVASFPILEYWLDIGQPSDYDRAQKDIEEGRL